MNSRLEKWKQKQEAMRQKRRDWGEPEEEIRDSDLAYLWYVNKDTAATLFQQVEPIPKTPEGVEIGYLVALSVGTSYEKLRSYRFAEEPGPDEFYPQMYACTEDCDHRQTWWEVPDAELFRLLSVKLAGCALERESSYPPQIGEYVVYWTSKSGWGVDIN